MAFNIPDTYQNTTPAEPLDQKTLNKMVWRSLFLQASFNYERMQAAGWLYGILPGLEKIHGDNKDDLAASMSHNLQQDGKTNKTHHSTGNGQCIH